MGQRILIIDDDVLAVHYYVRHLSRSGFEVIHHRSADGVLELVQRWEPDVIVLDVMLPPGVEYSLEETNRGLRTGVILSERVRRQYPTIKQVVLTNSRNAEAMSEMPADVILNKHDYPPSSLTSFLNGLCRELGTEND